MIKNFRFNKNFVSFFKLYTNNDLNSENLSGEFYHRNRFYKKFLNLKSKNFKFLNNVNLNSNFNNENYNPLNVLLINENIKKDIEFIKKKNINNNLELNDSFNKNLSGRYPWILKSYMLNFNEKFNKKVIN